MGAIQMMFEKFARKIADFTGSIWGFLAALSVVIIWIILGPFLKFSDLWQLSINTGTTIVTFLMVFLIQQTQNIDGRAVQVKLDELIKVTAEARNSLIGAEKRGSKEIQELEEELERIVDVNEKVTEKILEDD